MSGTTAFGIVLTAILVISLAVTGVMLWWAAREDGRDHERINAGLDRDDE